MVDRAGDAQADVQVRGDGQTGLADLLGSRGPALVAGDARRAHGTAEHLSNGAHQLEVTIHAAATTHDGGGVGQGHAFLVVGHGRDDLNCASLGAQLDGQGLRGQGDRRGHRGLVNDARSDADDRGLSFEHDAHRPGATQGGLADLEDAAVEADGGGAGDHAGLGEGADAASDLTTAVVRAQEHQAKAATRQRGHKRVGGDDRGTRGVTQVGVQKLGRAQLGQRSHVGRGGQGQGDDVGGGQGGGQRHGLSGQGRQVIAHLVGQNEDRGTHLLRHVTSPPKGCSRPERARPRRRPE